MRTIVLNFYVHYLHNSFLPCSVGILVSKARELTLSQSHIVDTCSSKDSNLDLIDIQRYKTH